MVNIEKVKKQIYSSVATNRNPLYDSHIYWSQKPYNICDILIENFSNPGDTIYDPFLGSGVTLLQSINNHHKRKGIGTEINEAPLFIVETLLKQYDPKKFKEISELYLYKIRELQTYYSTYCPICGKNGVITKTVFDKPTRDSDIKIKTINYRCTCSQKLVKEADETDYEKINFKQQTNNVKDMLLIPNSKIAVYEGQRISQIFTGRNFKILDEIVGITNSLTEYNEIFKYILMSVLHLCKITDKHSNSQWPLWIPKTDCVEKNVIDLIEKKVKNFNKTIKYLSENYSDTCNYKLLHKGSQHVTVSDIPDNSVNLIITDPPYLGQVMYSEYMQLYKPFLNLDFNIDDEIIVSSAPSRKRTEDDYFKLINNVFSNCSDKLINNGYLCLYFHDCSLTVWNRLIACLSENHFSYISQAHISKSNTLKNIISPKKSLNGDCVLFFVKDSTIQYRQQGVEDIDEIELNIIRQAKHLIKQYKTLSTPELYDKGLMEILIQNGWLETLSKKYKSLVDIFEKHLKWDSDTSKWVC